MWTIAIGFGLLIVGTSAITTVLEKNKVPLGAGNLALVVLGLTCTALSGFAIAAALFVPSLVAGAR